MKLLQYEHERRGKQNCLKIHVIPTKYIDRDGKARTISPRFSWSLTRFHADRHPLDLAIHRATGMISGELNDHAFGARLLGFGDVGNLSPIDYKCGQWRRSKDKRTVYFDGGGFELSLALVGTSMKQTVEIRDRQFLQPLVERLWLGSAKHNVHKTNRVACVTERGREERAEQIKLEVAGEVIGQINRGFVCNAEHSLPLTYRIIDDGAQILLVTELPAEVRDWALPIFIDPTTSFGFTKNCGVCNLSSSAFPYTYTDHQHPTAMSNAGVASQANLWSDSAYMPTIDDNGVFYADVFLPHYLKTIIRHATKMTVNIQGFTMLGSSPSAGQIKTTLLPFKMRPVDMYLPTAAGSWTRDTSAANERSGISPLAVFSVRNKVYDATVYQRQDVPCDLWSWSGLNATLFDGTAKTGGRLQEMFNDFLNSDREDSLTLMICAKATGGFTGLQLSETTPFTLSIDWSNFHNQNPRDDGYAMPPTEPSISFVEDKIVPASGLTLYSAMGVSVRDMESGDQLSDSYKDPFKLDQRLNVRDDYYYFDGYAAPFNHVPNSNFLRTLVTATSGGVSATTDTVNMPDYTRDVAEARKLVLSYSGTSSNNFAAYFTGTDLQTTAYHYYLIPLHNLEFLYPHAFQMWVRNASANSWRAALITGFDFVSGKWNVTPLKNGSQDVGQATAWTRFTATINPNYTTSWNQSRPIGSVVGGEPRLRTFNAKSLLGVNYSPYSCFLMIWSASSSTTGNPIEIAAPTLVRTQSGQDIPNEAATHEVDLTVGGLDYQRVMARKNRIFQLPLRDNMGSALSWGTGSVTSNGLTFLNYTISKLPYTDTNTYAALNPAWGSCLRADLNSRLLDEGTIEFWYSPCVEIESRNSKRLARLNQYDANGKMIGKPWDGNAQHAIATSYEDTGNIFDPALRHILSLGNLPSVGSSGVDADTAVLSGAGMSLVRCGNSLIWMIREPGFTYDSNDPADIWNVNAGLSNSQECVRPRDKAFYKCQFDIPESMIAGSTSAFNNAAGQADNASWMHIKLVWGPRMEMYINGQLVDINNHQGFVTGAAMSETTNSPTNYAWNNARTGELTALRLGNMSLSYRVNSDMNQNLSQSPYNSDRGFNYVLQSDAFLIQELGISNTALSQIKSATRSEQTNTVGNVDNAEWVSALAVGSVSDAGLLPTAAIRRYTSATAGTPVEYEVADTALNHMARGGELRLCATVNAGATKLYLKGRRMGDGATRFRVYFANASWFPTSVVNNDSTETGASLADAAAITITPAEPGAVINFTGYIPQAATQLYLQETGFGRQAAISSVNIRNHAAGTTYPFAGPYIFDRTGGNTFVIRANMASSEHQYNGYGFGFGTTPATWYTIRDWHLLANGWVVVRTEETLPGSLAASAFTLQARSWSGVLTATSAALFGLDYDPVTQATTNLTGRTINVFSCALEDKGMWRNSGTSNAWHASDKLALENPYPVPVGNPLGIAGVCAWYDGFWHLTCKTGNANAGVRLTATSGSFTLIEDKVGAVVQEDSSHWIVKDGCHAIFKPSSVGAQFTLKRWWSDPNQSVTTTQLYSGGRSVALTPLTHDFNSTTNGWMVNTTSATFSRVTDLGNMVLRASTSISEGFYFNSGVTLTGDWTLTMRARCTNNSGVGAYTGIVFGMQAAGVNGYRFNFGEKGLYRVVNGASTSVGSFSQAWADVYSAYHVFKLVKIGNTYQLFVDGASCGALTDSTYTSGTVGLYGVYTNDIFVDYATFDCQAVEPSYGFNTPADITYYGDTKNALVFQGTLNNTIDWGSRDIPSETDKWVIEGRSRELDHGWTGSRRMEYGDFQMVIANIGADSNVDYTGYRTGSSYSITNYGGITLTFHTSEQYQGTPMAGGHYYPHLMPLYNVLTGFDGFWNSSTSPAGPDAGNNAIIYNANRWCRFPFHYKSIKYLYGRTGDDSANCYMRFVGHARQTDRGVMRVELRVLGGRYLQEGFTSAQVASEQFEKFVRAQVVGEPCGYNIRALNSRIMDLDNLFNYHPAPQLWFDGRDWNLRQAGVPTPTWYNSAYYAPIGGFMFRSIFAESFDCLTYPQGWQGARGNNIANLLVVGDGRMTAPGNTHPTARVGLSTPLYFDPGGQPSALEAPGGYQYKTSITYPDVVLNGSYNASVGNVPAGVGGPAYTDFSTNFGTFAMKPGTSSCWDNFLGHIKFRFQEGAGFPYDYITHSDTGLRAVKCIHIYKAQCDDGLYNQFHLGRDAQVRNIAMQSAASATGVKDGRGYPPQQYGDMTQWWSGRIPQPQSHAVSWNFKRDIFPLNGRRVKMIAFATCGRRHISMQTQAPTWNYPSDTQRGVETAGADLANAPQSMFLRKADQEHAFRYPFNWDGSYVFTNNRLLGQWDSPYVLSEGGTYVALIRTSDTPLFTSPDLCVESDSVRLAAIPQYYKTVAAGQIRRFVVKIKNEGTAITFADSEITLSLAATQNGAPWATKTNTGSVTIPADGTTATIIFENVAVPTGQAAGPIYATLHFPAKAPVMPQAVDMSIAGAASMNVQLHPAKNLTLYRNPNHDTDAGSKEQTIFRIGGDANSSEDDLNPNGSVPMHELHYNRGNYVTGTHIQARVTRDHPYPRWDMRIAKRIPEWMTGGTIGATTIATIADLEGIDRDASYMQGLTSADAQETIYGVVDLLATKINTEPYLYRMATSADYTGGSGQEQTLNKNAEYLRVHARPRLYVGNTTHKGSRMRLYLYAYVCGRKEFVEVTGNYTSTTASANPLVTFSEQDPPVLSIPVDGSGNANLTCDLDRAPATADTILVEKGPAPNQYAAWGNWNLRLLNAANGTRTRASIKPYGMLTIYSSSPTSKEFEPDSFGNLHELGDNYPEPNTYQAGGANFTVHFQGRYTYVNNDIDPRTWRFDLAPQDSLTYDGNTWRNRDTNGCPYQGGREITGPTPYIKILGPPILTIKKVEQRHRDSTDFNGTTAPRINWNTEAAGCVRLEFDCQVVGESTYSVDFLITTDGKRAFVRPHGWVDSLAIAGSTYLTDPLMHNDGGPDAADMDAGATPHFTAVCGNTPTRVKIDIDLKHFAYGGPTYDHKTGNVTIGIQARRTSPTITSTASQAIGYFCQDPTGFTLTFSAATTDFTQGVMQYAMRDATPIGAGNNLYGNAQDLQYSYGMEGGASYKTWYIMPGTPVALDPMCQGRWNSISFRVLDKYGNAATKTIAKPWDTDTPALAAGTKLLPQNGDLTKSAIDIQSGSSTLYLRLPGWTESCPKTWGAALTVNGTPGITGSWNNSATEASVMPLGKHVEPTMSQWSPFVSGAAPIWQVFHANDFTTQNPARDGRGWWVWDGNPGETVDTELGVAAFHSWGAPRVVLQNTDICWSPIGNVPLRTMYNGVWYFASKVYLTLKVDPFRGSNGYTTQAQPLSQPTWRCRFGWRHSGEADSDPIPHWKDFFVYDDGRWHTYVLDMSVEPDWIGPDPDGRKAQFYIIFGANYDRENVKELPTDQQTIYFKYMMSNGDTTNLAAPAPVTHVYLAHFGVAIDMGTSRLGSIYTPMTISGTMDGDDEILVSAQLTDWGNRSVAVGGDAANKYYVIPKVPGPVSVSHKKSANGLLEAKVVSVNQGGEPAAGVQYRIEWRAARQYDDIKGSYDDWQTMSSGGTDLWYTVSQWGSGGYVLSDLKEGQRYLFRARARNPRNINCMSAPGPASEWFSDYISPQFIGASHFTDAVHFAADERRPAGSSAKVNSRLASWNPVDVGKAMEVGQGAWLDNANGRYYKSDWNGDLGSGKFYNNLAASTDPTWSIDIRNFAGCKDGIAYYDQGNTEPNHPVDGYFYTVTWGESSRDTVPSTSNSLWLATSTVPGYPILRLTATLNPSITPPCVGYMHIRPAYKINTNWYLFDPAYTAHVAIYFDRADGLHPAAARIKTSFARGRDGDATRWNSAPSGDVWTIAAEVVPVLGINSSVERQMWHNYRLYAKPSGIVSPIVTGGWLDWQCYDPNGAQWAICGGLKEHQCYELNYQVRNAAGLLGPAPTTFGSPTYTNVRPPDTIVNIYPSGEYTRFVWNRVNNELGTPAQAGMGSYQIWDWMNGREIALVPFSGIAQYNVAVKLEGGLQGGYIVKANNNQGYPLIDYQVEPTDWSQKPYQRQPGGWKPAIYDYLTLPRIGGITIGIGYNMGDNSGGNNKFIRALPAQGVNQDTAQRQIYYDLNAHPWLMPNQLTQCGSDKYHNLTQYLTEVYKKDSHGTVTRLGFARGDGILDANYNDAYWFDLLTMRGSTFQTIRSDQMDQAVTYGFRMRARQRNASGTQPAGDTEDDQLEGSWWTMSSWSDTVWGNGAMREAEDYQDLLHLYVRAGGNDWWDKAYLVQDISPNGKAEMFKDVRCAFKVVGAETTDVDSYPAQVGDWIRTQMQVQQDQPVDWWQLKRLPNSFVRVVAELTFNDSVGTLRTLTRVISLWDSEAKQGNTWTGWGVHSPQKDGLYTIHNDYGQCKFNAYAPEVAPVAAGGWISQQRTDQWYYAKWNLYDDALSGLETVGCPGSLKSYGVDWSAVTNVRLYIYSLVLYGEGIYSTGWQPQGLEWRNDQSYCQFFERAQSGVLIRDFSIGWTWGRGTDAWNGSYEWTTQPMNIRHNPALDLYRQAQGNAGSLATTRPPDFIYKKSTTMPSNNFGYDSYVKEVVED